MLTHWTHSGFAPDAFWEQTLETFNAAMEGARRARKDAWQMALYTAYHSGYYATRNWEKVPPFEELITPKAPLTNAEIAARFAAMAAKHQNGSV